MGSFAAILLVIGIIIAIAGLASRPPQRSWGAAAYGAILCVISLGAILHWWSERFCFAWLIFLNVCVLAVAIRGTWPDRRAFLFGGVALCYLGGCIAIAANRWIEASIAAMLGVTALMLLLDGLGVISESRYWRPIACGIGALVVLICVLSEKSHDASWAILIPALLGSNRRPAHGDSRTAPADPPV